MKESVRRSATSGTSAASSADDKLITRALWALATRAQTPGPLLTTVETLSTWFRLRLSPYPNEVFAVAWLDTKNRLIEFRELFQGTLDRTAVHTRVVVQSALACNAAAGVFAHNHPSGDGRPSSADVGITQELQAALALVEVKLLDHFVVTAAAAPVSLVQAGLIRPPPGSWTVDYPPERPVCEPRRAAKRR
ncbi:JAB domain-containing protein [Tahibacter harae]|uniref:JAB domain-containing protein n=1 Tax=Tahibacter harae TaxID=2963937 RepID=A0ABT1QYP8_9GAMM|nr:JAB domain-containing protein [Tahibacter harae]MCQ4167396.1 JAB domain-containing protein [Tahibacter harae]